MSAPDGLAILSPPWVEIEHRPRLWQRWLLGWRPSVLRLRPARIRDLGALIELIPIAQSPGPDQDRAALGCIAMCASVPPERLERLPRAVLATAVHALVGLHPELFRPLDEPDEPADEPARRRTWADQIATLVGGGHRLEDIEQWTLAQYRAHLEAADRREAMAQACAIMAARYGCGPFDLQPIIARLTGDAP